MTEETATSQVPLLDLAPKLKRPLSLWNPLDYLRLLYWVFYFPQAIRWYVETYCEPLPESSRLTWEQRWELIQNNPRKRQLAIMGLCLGTVAPILFCFILERLGSEVDWNFILILISCSSLLSLIVGLLFGVAGGVITIVSLPITFSIAYCVWRSIAWWIWKLIWGVVWHFEWHNLVGQLVYRLIEGITFGFGLGIIMSIFLGRFKKIKESVNFLSSTFSLIILILPIVAGIYSNSIFIALISLLSWLIAWLISLLAFVRFDNIWFSSKRIPRITPLISSKLSCQLCNWLDNDWNKGVINANQILKYSSQFLTVDFAINNVLETTKTEDLLERISVLYDYVWDWDIAFYTYSSLKNEVISEFVKGIFWLPYKSYLINRFNSLNKFKIDTPSRIASIAFMRLRDASVAASRQERTRCVDSLSMSIQLFEYLRHIKHGEEMYQLAYTIREFSQVRSVLSLLDINPPIIPNGNVLRDDTWFIINEIFSAVEELRIVVYSSSRSARSFALNRSLGHIKESIEKLQSFSKSHIRFETSIICNVLDILQEYLFSVSGLIGQIEIKEPIINPYIIGDPVIGDRFIGREGILRQLEELWFINTSPQSVILYGHRRMGKTSILRNATTKVNSEVRVAYVNLLSVSSANNGITDILMAICDALEEVTEIPVPSNNDLHQFPETTFRRYLEQITKTFTGKGLIIALDEFEKIEELIDAGKLSKEFLGFLRGMVQMSSKLAFAFAGLHTLQEMNSDYFQPFYASFIPISVAFLTRDATHQVLANPDPEFLLEYEPAALDHIYDLTNGQPYLTQLIGFQLVRMFNDYVFEQGKPRDRTFTIDDVRTICSGENFFNTGINYFNGVWQQAAEGAAHQQDILKTLAPHPQGLNESELISQTNLPSETLQVALKTLKDHDVIRSQKTNEIVNWAIAVELFRTWVEKYKLM
jgi:hypothetical protein